MFAIATADEAKARRLYKTMQNFGNWVNDYFGKDLALEQGHGPSVVTGADTPMAYLVEQSPNSTVPAHFHLVDQFQIVVSGKGSLGKHRVSEFLVHYTNAYTSYGPIVSEENGINYFTLRGVWDATRAHAMPESRGELLKVPRRHLTFADVERTNPAQLTASDAAVSVHLHEIDETGLAVSIQTIPPHGSGAFLDPVSGNGQYWLVLDGSLEIDARRLPEHSLVFISKDEPPRSIHAGPEGLEILLMQFPISRSPQ